MEDLRSSWLRVDLEETRQSVLESSAIFQAWVDHGLAVMSFLDGSEPVPEDTLGFLASALQVSRPPDGNSAKPSLPRSKRNPFLAPSLTTSHSFYWWLAGLDRAGCFSPDLRNGTRGKPEGCTR